MVRENTTEIELFNAIDRIINTETIRIPSSRRLSVRAVEDEAGLGDGSAYYYSEIIKKIKECIFEGKNLKTSTHQGTDFARVKESLKKEIKIKDKYRQKILLLEDRIKLMAKEHNELARQMVMYKEMAEDLQNQMASSDKI
jgi:hypothetical protein